MLVPPPWTLTGNGLVVIYRFPRAFVLPWIPPHLHDAFCGGFGAVICVDYHSSNIGPYQELLLIPGRFAFGNRRYYSITQIFVSTTASVENGQANWAIPKQQADFVVGRNIQSMQASRAGQVFFSVACDAVGPSYPVTTTLLPFQFVLAQQNEHATLITRLAGRGAAQRALQQSNGDGVVFPNLSQVRPLLAVSLHAFTLVFPKPTYASIKE